MSSVKVYDDMNKRHRNSQRNLKIEIQIIKGTTIERIDNVVNKYRSACECFRFIDQHFGSYIESGFSL